MSGGVGPFGSLPSDALEYDDFLFADDEALYSQLVDDATNDNGNTNGNSTGDDDWDSNIWYGFETEGFPNYMPGSRDPGYWMFVFVVLYTVVLMIGLPIMVVLGKRWERRRNERAEFARAVKGAGENNGGEVEEEDFADEPAGALEQGRAAGAVAPAAGVPQTAASEASNNNNNNKKKKKKKKRQQLQPTPAVDHDQSSQISSTTFQHQPSTYNDTTTAANDQSQSLNFTADFSNLHDMSAMTGHNNTNTTTTNLLPALRASSEVSGAVVNEYGETASDLLFPANFSDVYNSVNNLTAVADDDDAVNDSGNGDNENNGDMTDHAVNTEVNSRLNANGHIDDTNDTDDFVDDEDPSPSSRAAASPAKSAVSGAANNNTNNSAAADASASTMAIGANGFTDNDNDNDASMDTVDAMYAAEEREVAASAVNDTQASADAAANANDANASALDGTDLFNHLDVADANNLTAVPPQGQGQGQGQGQQQQKQRRGVGGSPTDDSFESALREIGTNDAVLRSVMNTTTSAVVGAGDVANAPDSNHNDNGEEDEEDARSVLSDAVSSVLSAGASALSGVASGVAGLSASVSEQITGTGTGTSTLNDTAVEDMLNCTVDDASAEPAPDTGTAPAPVSNPHAQQLPQHNIPFNRFSMQANHPAGGGGARSTISAAPTTMTTVSRFNRRAEGFLDRLFIPSYPDDASDYAPSAIGGGGGHGHGGVRRANTTISAATTSRLVPDGNAIFPPVQATNAAADAAARDSFARPRVVDALGRPGAGAGGRRRRGARRGFGGGIGRPEMIRRAIEQEERSEMASAMTGKYSAAHQSGPAAAAGDANRSEIAGGAKGNSRVSGPVSEMMSGVMDISSPSSAISAISGLRPWKRKAAASAVSGFTPSEVPSVWKNFHEDDIGPNDAADADDPGKAKMYIDEMEVETTVCCGQWALWKPKTIAHGADKVVSLAEPDNEIKRIIRLGIPFTLSTVSEAFFDAVIVAVLSRFLGTNAVTAYVLVELLLGLSDELIGGIIDAEGTICAHAFGAGNNFLAGQYVQISLLFYVVVSIPFLLMWAYVMGDTLRILGFNEDIQTIGAEYTRVVIFNYLIDGVAEAFGALLDITGHEYFGLFLDIVHNVVNLGAVLALVIVVPDARLVTVGFIQLVIGASFLVIMLSWAIFKGWYSAFWGGMLGSFAFTNFQAVKNVFLTALPLSVGSFLEYGEWELLTFFTAYLGPAEVATWALLGTIWELFEASTEGIGEAAAVRVAYHLGKGHPDMAELSSYKSMLLSFGLSLFVTAGFFLCGYDLPTWFSSDETIQRMLAELIPLVGFGNITMNFGMVAWSLVGAQGRYRLATLVSMISSWLVTIPLAVIFIIGLNINLKGLVGAVIAGYSTSSVILMYIILRSDWVRLSKIVQELNAMTGEIDSSDDEDDDSSESSSDSSSSSDDDSSDDDSSSSSSSDDENAMDDSDLNVSHVSQKHLLA